MKHVVGPAKRITPDGKMHHQFYPPNEGISRWILNLFPAGYVGYCVDVGASDGMSINSTYLLEKECRWTVISVEANPFFKPMLMKQRAFVKMCALSNKPADDAMFHMNLDNLEAYSSLRPSNHPRMLEEAGERWATVKVPVRTLEQLLAEFEFSRLDALCIDTEGTELDVLGGIDLKKWTPLGIVVESWDKGGHDAYLAQFGYERMWRSVDNDCYVRRSK